MRIKEIKVYKFDELSPKAKQKAIEWYQRASEVDEWWDNIYEDAANIGIKITGFDIDRGSYCKMQFLSGAEETAHNIEKDHGETCDTYKTAKAYLKERDSIIEKAPKENEEIIDEAELDAALDECDKDFLKALSEDYLTMLRNEYEHVNSEETITENIIANDYEFDENGRIA